MPPWQIQHESHTCSELSLRILLWNASYVQKQSLTGVGQWKDLKNSDSCHRHSQCRLEWTGSWPFPFNEATSLPNWQIVKTVQVQSEIKSKSKCFSLVWKNCLKIDMPVLGLAGCHWRENWNGFAGASPGVPGDILGSYGELRWMEPHMSSPPPALINNKSPFANFTPLQMVHTHAPQQRGFLRLRQMRWRWRWKGNWNEMTMEMRWQLLNRDTGRGTQKRRGERGTTNTNTPSPERANPERARTDDGPNTDQRRGRIEAPDTTYKARAKTYPGTRRTQNLT